MRLPLIALLMTVSTAALADATVTIALTGAGANNTTRSFVISDANGARYLAWARAAYPTNPPVSSDPLVCVDPLPPQCLPTPTTAKQAIEQAFEAMLRGLRDNVVNNDRATASKAAGDAIAPIDPK